jgi:hypothetical protein
MQLKPQPYCIRKRYDANEVASAPRPSRSRSTQETQLFERDVNGETKDASASLSASPTCASRKAPQSFPPSPHIPTTSPRVWWSSIT